MAFQQGLSGLNVAGKALDVTSNNIANASTVGFKSARANFADVYGAAMQAGGGSQIGIGVSLAAVQQQFTQGNITTTSNALDMAINGAGFYKVEQDGILNYTRNGQFHLDASGYIVNDQGRKLMGVQADNQGNIPEISDSNTVGLNVSDNVGTPQATTEITLKANLNGNASAPTATTGTEIPPTGSGQYYNNARSMDVYDSQGGAHTLTYYFQKTANSNEWNVYAGLTKTDSTTNVTTTELAPYSMGQVRFDTNGIVDTATTSLTFNAANLPIAGSVEDLAVTIDVSNMTQFKSQFSVDSMTQNGYAKGNLAGLSVSPDGTVQARYDNGKTTNIGRVALYNFSNPNGLQSLGNNMWAETAASGQPTSNYPGVGNTGVIQSSAIEESNVDLTQELVQLIIQQRNYQANAQSIKTQDQVMQTLVNLR